MTIVDTTATCTAPGETGFMAKVTFNGKDYTDKQTVTGEALGHDWTVSEWIWSDDYTSVTAKFVCSRDPSHTDSVTATDIDINEVTATCEKEGKTEYSVEIAFDGNTYSDTAVVRSDCDCDVYLPERSFAYGNTCSRSDESRHYGYLHRARRNRIYGKSDV